MRGRACGKRGKLRINPSNSSTNNSLNSQIEIEKWIFFSKWKDLAIKSPLAQSDQ